MTTRKPNFNEVRRLIMPLPQPDPSPEYWERYCATLPTLGAAWLTACKTSGKRLLLCDTMGTRLTGFTALVGSIVLARRIARLCPGENVGLLLPSSAASVLCNMACMLLGKTAVNLNFTSSTEVLSSSIRQAKLHTIFTSARFLERLQGRGINVEQLRQHSTLILLEDLRADTGKLEKLRTLLACAVLPLSTLLRRHTVDHDLQRNAVILFSSGSEGTPKGVMLSHCSLMANVQQTALLLAFKDDDVVLANLPPFHAFGLTATYFLPLLHGRTVLCHPDPTDVAGSAHAIAEHKVSVMFGTSSFFRLYVRNPKVQPEQLASLRLVVGGAEKLQRQVVSEFAEKFGKTIYEGYGATETAPVACVNLPEDKRPSWLPTQPLDKPGSVGRPLPGTRIRITDPDTFEPLPTGSAGMVLISGPQVMHGYLDDHERTGHVIRSLDDIRWYVSGDKGYLDEAGFLFIDDRYSRFAKISGEMVGLGTVEQALRNAIGDPELEVLVVSLPDARKGEKLVVLSTQALDPQRLRERLVAGGLPALALPAAYFTVDAIPRLGSGKTDFNGGKKLAQELAADLG
jgi:acyl-[acyl-carrier-protein]-phospholipid O-acyltransferase / long-chain-fatty-acid--[acyl-carrier-protein] ligase